MRSAVWNCSNLVTHIPSFKKLVFILFETNFPQSVDALRDTLKLNCTVVYSIPYGNEGCMVDA
jgi:hypothetical protein